MAVASELMSAFTGAGMSKAGAAGMIGNWTQESALDPSAAGGLLGQWQGDRMSALQNYAAKIGKPVTSADAQALFAVHELQTGYPQLWATLRTTNDPTTAATAISQQYERPGIPMLQNRIAAAQKAMGLSGSTSASGSTAPSSGTNTSSGPGLGSLFAASDGQTTNPLLYATVWIGALAMGVWLLYSGFDRSTHGGVSSTVHQAASAAALGAKVT